MLVLPERSSGDCEYSKREKGIGSYPDPARYCQVIRSEEMKRMIQGWPFPF